MLTSFQRAIGKFSRRDQVKIEAVLRVWSATPTGVTVAPNLRDREHFLPTRFMVQLLKVLRDCASLPIQEIEERYQKKCYRLQRRGGSVRLSCRGSIMLGCAIDRELFVDHLVKISGGYIPTKGLALRLVQKLKSNRVLFDREKAILLKAYTTWVTWNEQNPSVDPFSFVNYDLADEVRASLGIDERQRGALLLFRYLKPPELALHRPTIADAELFKYFSPPILMHAGYGYTRPWERLLLRIGGDDVEINAAPRPEGVHEPINLELANDRVIELP